MSTETRSAAAEPASPTIEHRPATSRRGRALGPILRVVVRPILDIAPLTPWLLARLHVFDLVGNLLRLPTGAHAQHRAYGEFDAELVTGTGVSTSRDAVVLYFHGGAFLSCGLRTHRRLVSRISTASEVPVLQVNYRQLPAAKLSHTISDCVQVYRALLDDGYDPTGIVLAGDSAGGYLAFATALRAIADGLPGPAGVAALSPWLDLRCEHSAGHHNARGDAYLPVKQLAKIAGLLGDGTDPLPSVLDADLSAMPPVLIQVGSTEVLRSDADLMAARLTEAGVHCALQIWDRQIHVFQAAADVVPEGRTAIEDIGAFVKSLCRNRSQHPPTEQMRTNP